MAHTERYCRRHAWYAVGRRRPQAAPLRLSQQRRQHRKLEGRRALEEAQRQPKQQVLLLWAVEPELVPPGNQSPASYQVAVRV